MTQRGGSAQQRRIDFCSNRRIITVLGTLKLAVRCNNSSRVLIRSRLCVIFLAIAAFQQAANLEQKRRICVARSKCIGEQRGQWYCP